jgi:hypothetical protein
MAVEAEVFGENTPQHDFIHNKPHMTLPELLLPKHLSCGLTFYGSYKREATISHHHIYIQISYKYSQFQRVSFFQLPCIKDQKQGHENQHICLYKKLHLEEIHNFKCCGQVHWYL